ncbi:MAG: sterol desaturase family protein [Vulcanimicrobiaceae bacterium]
MRRIPATVLTGMLVTVELGILLVAEVRSPERDPCEARATRLARNGVLGGFALAATGLLETPLVMRVAAAAERRRWGLLPRLRAPRALRAIVAVTLLDYGIYAWHAAMHRVPLLWRLHLVHHADRDWDVCTAVRLHAVVLARSGAVRGVPGATLGVTPQEFALWQRLFGMSVIFHHANVSLPAALDRVLGAVIMTPRRHGIHHLARRDDQHGNWSSGLIVWDRLHGTLREGDAAGEVGIPAYRAESDVTLAKMLALPFAPQPDAWVAR